MRIVSINENQKIEKRIAITPEIAKKYINSGFEIVLSKNYGNHLGFDEKDYTELGVKIDSNDNEIIKSADIIIQLGLIDDDKISILKPDQIFVGVLNPFENKNKLLEILNSKVNSCKNVDFTIFGLSLAAINLLLSVVIFIFIIKVIKNEKNK